MFVDDVGDQCASCLQRREREREKVRMLALRLFAVVAVALLCTSAVRCSFCDDGDGYVTVFNDDFDGERGLGGVG